MNISGISNSVIRRLPRYYRFLSELKSAGISRISSAELAKKMGVTASQIRQDLNCFGGFGQQGYGYNTELLKNEIGKILGLDNAVPAILIGAGNLGRAVALHMNFDSLGFKLIGIFDRKESLIGQMVRNLPIRNVSSVDEFCRENLPKVAIFCVPKSEANAVAKNLVKCGIKAFWNFSHYDFASEYPDIIVENMHFSDSLMTLSYKLTNNEKTD